MSKSTDGKRPPIHLLDAEADSLSDLAMQVEARLPDVAGMLNEEIDRAVIYSRESLPADVVTMMSVVEFVDEGSGAGHVVKLVWPRDANMAENRLSILTHVGAGLIGMKEGQAIEWPDRNGRKRSLRIVKVSQPELVEDAA